MMKVFSPEEPVPQRHNIVVPTYRVVPKTGRGNPVFTPDRILSRGTQFVNVHFDHDNQYSTNSDPAISCEWNASQNRTSSPPV